MFDNQLITRLSILLKDVVCNWMPPSNLRFLASLPSGKIFSVLPPNLNVRETHFANLLHFILNSTINRVTNNV